MQPSNLRLYATKYHLQLYFIIFTTSHHIFQSITFLATMVNMPKHGKYDYIHDYVCSHKYHSLLHDYVVHDHWIHCLSTSRIFVLVIIAWNILYVYILKYIYKWPFSR
jgi:hypothetical protein